MTAIVLAGLGKDYGETVVIRSIDLTVRSGDLFFLLGPSGCGKTTLLRMIAGFIEPTRGRIRFGERDVTHMPANRRNAGMVFQSYALWPHMSVRENVAFGLQVRRLPRDEQRRRVIAALERVQMAEYADRKPNQLSGGQQQRVALARALAIEPTVLLLDEPLSNLDAKLRLEMRSEIRRLVTELRVTTVYVTHDQKEALSMADEVAVLRKGEVMQRGAPEDLYRRPASRFVADFLGETNFVSGTLARREGAGWLVETAIGALRSTCDAPGLAAERQVLVSLRPEALRLVEPTAAAPPSGERNRIPGLRRSTIYLGDSAQHAVEAVGGITLKVHEANPGAHRADALTVEVAPEDVVLIRE